ncbi:MAG: DUF5629 family protein [Pseudomonas sp.]|uniref:DUF5629 family protein n=1 Tax=Pseudomonas sp. TaxID=306 RepID=UPI0033920BC9
MTHPTLLDALHTTDMLEIDGLHSWQFSLEPAATTAAEPGAALARGERFLSIECMDGRARREWHFSQEAVLAATFDTDRGGWLISDHQGPHLLICMSGISVDGDTDDAEDDSQAAAN